MKDKQIAASGHYFEFSRGEWVQYADGSKERFPASGLAYFGGLTLEQRVELDGIVRSYLGGRYHPKAGAQVEVMLGGDLKITVDGSTHVRSPREWYALAVAALRPAPQRKPFAQWLRDKVAFHSKDFTAQDALDAAAVLAVLPVKTLPTAAEADPCAVLCRECKVGGHCIKRDPIFQDFSKSEAA